MTSRERRSLTYIHFLGGASIQSYNTNATAWALAEYLYRAGREYYMVPVGLAIGAALVIAHRIFVFVSPHSPLPPLPRYLRYIYISSFEKNSNTPSPPFKIVHPPSPQLRHARTQSSPTHPIRRLHPLQPIPNLRHSQPTLGRIFCAILSPQLSSEHL